MAWAGFLNSPDGIGICHHVSLTLAGDWTQPVVVNLTSGRDVRHLPTVPGLIGIGPGGGFQADPSGHYLSFIGYGLGARGLYRWNVVSGTGGHQSRPVFVKNNVGNAS
jgi:hypothetical protein